MEIPREEPRRPSRNQPVDDRFPDGGEVADLLQRRLAHLEQQLDDRFLRIHRSYIVNADRVARHTAGAVVVDGRTLEVSRKYRDSVRAAIPESAPSARVRHISNDKPS